MGNFFTHSVAFCAGALVVNFIWYVSVRSRLIRLAAVIQEGRKENENEL